MRSRLAWTLSLLALMTFSGEAFVAAQGMPSPYGVGAMPAYSPAWSNPQAGMMGMPGGPPGMGMPPGMAMPAGYQEGANGPMHVEGMMPMPADGMGMGGCTDGCGPCGAGGYGANGEMMGEEGLGRRRLFGPGGGGRRGNRGGLYGDAIGFRWLRFFLPDDDGGACAVRWYDIGADWVYFHRANRQPDLVVSELGFAQNIPALALSDLDFGASHGFRFYANMQLGSASSLEFAYLGPLSNRATAVAADPLGASLFSIFSGFGAFPFGQGFAETDGATFHSLMASSELDSFELNYRSRWVAPECRYQGSWLVGVRYLKFDDDLLYQTFTPRGRMDHFTDTNNSLTGLQLGGDLWITPLPGLRLGAEGKVGVFGNRMSAGTTIATTSPGFFNENIASGHVAFAGELDLQMTYRLNYHWTVRAGYNFLWINGVATAADNFNPVPPPVFNVPPNVVRDSFIDRSGEAFFHGMNLGLEYLW